jgi:hypothetical protein
MDVLGHNYIANDDELIAIAHLLQHGQKEVATARGAKQRLSAITTAGNEMKVAGAVVAPEIAPHAHRIAAQECGRGDSGHRPTVMKESEAGGPAIAAGGHFSKRREKWRTPCCLASTVQERPRGILFTLMWPTRRPMFSYSEPPETLGSLFLSAIAFSR